MQEYNKCQAKVDKYQERERTGPNIVKLDQVSCRSILCFFSTSASSGMLIEGDLLGSRIHSNLLTNDFRVAEQKKLRKGRSIHPLLCFLLGFLPVVVFVFFTPLHQELTVNSRHRKAVAHHP